MVQRIWQQTSTATSSSPTSEALTFLTVYKVILSFRTSTFHHETLACSDYACVSRPRYREQKEEVTQQHFMEKSTQKSGFIHHNALGRGKMLYNLSQMSKDFTATSSCWCSVLYYITEHCRVINLINTRVKTGHFLSYSTTKGQEVKVTLTFSGLPWTIERLKGYRLGTVCVYWEICAGSERERKIYGQPFSYWKYIEQQKRWGICTRRVYVSTERTSGWKLRG